MDLITFLTSFTDVPHNVSSTEVLLVTNSNNIINLKYDNVCRMSGLKWIIKCICTSVDYNAESNIDYYVLYILFGYIS